MIKAYIDDVTVKLNMTGSVEDIVPDTIILCSQIIKAAMNTLPPYVKGGDDYILNRITKLVKGE